MRVISRKTPTPRLLSTVVPELREGPPERITMKSRLKSVSIFSGNGRAIFLGMIVGAVLISTISALYVQRLAGLRHAEEKRKVVAVSTHRILPAEPIIVKISADLIHVSAISLGQPRLAIVNGKLVREAEQITVHPPTSSLAVTLRVVKISDGSIQLTDGTQVITARLELSQASKSKP